MIRLHLFGTVELRDRRSIEVRSVLAQPKRTALLGYLAAGRPGTMQRRASLVALFWPELDEAHARNSLSKSLHHLKRSLGEQAIETRGPEEVGVSPHHLWCDVAAFHTALETGDREGALALYARGPLMAGLQLPDAPGFDEWLDAERAALLRLAVNAAATLADVAEGNGDPAGAVRWARTAAELSRYDERVLCRLLRALDQAGDRAGAVTAFNEFAERLARELDLEPSPETKALAASIRARAEPEHVSISARASRADAVPEPRSESATRPHAISSAARRPQRLTLVLLSAAAGLSLLAVMSSLFRSEGRPLERFDVTPTEGQALVPGVAGIEFDLSADGTRIVDVGESPDGRTQLWQRMLGDRAAAPIPGTAGAVSPVFSPDGQTVVFEAAGSIRTISLRGGSSATVLTPGREPAWSPDGRTIYFSGGIEPGSVIHRIDATGGEPETVTRQTEGSQAHPMPLPGGRGLLLTIRPVDGRGGGIAVADLPGGEVRRIHDGATARYASSGHIVWGLPNGSMMAAPFNARRLEMTGPPVGLPETARYKVGATTTFALSATGSLLYRVGGRMVQELVWVSRAGGVEPVDPSWTGMFSSPALSPDGTLLSVSVLGTESADVWVKRLDRGPHFRFTLDGRQNTPSAWTPDGLFITFGSDRDGRFRMWTKRADGSGESVSVLPPGVDGNRGRWSPDGEWLIYRPGFVDGDILGIRPGRDTVPIPIIATPARERKPGVVTGRPLAGLHVKRERRRRGLRRAVPRRCQ